LRRYLVSIAVALAPAGALAQASPAPLDEIVVVGTSPLSGTGIDIDKVPSDVTTLSAGDIAREGTPSLADALSNQVGSVNINANLNDPFQPDILYRGFEASPVLGTPEGLAVYQNGVRINEAFGDTVNWDLIPDIAIDHVEIEGSNPVYGLNALGGAVLVTMKNGWNQTGGEAELAAGSFGQRSGTFEYGQHVGNIAAYVAARGYQSDGWRQFSPDSVQQLYADLAARTERLTFDVSFTGADNRLVGEGATPIQELAAGQSLVFTSPQNNTNELAFVTANATWRVNDTQSVEGNVYRREFHQTVLNGNATDYTACAAPGTFLCQSDGATPLMQPNGQPIPDISAGGTIPIGENDTETIGAVSQGGALQWELRAPLLGHTNQLTTGANLDHAAVNFQSGAEVGIVDPALAVQPSGLFVSTPENSGFTATPVSLNAKDDYYGAFATDTIDFGPKLSVTASGRYNLAVIALHDLGGPNLTGTNRYSRFNPAIGATYKLAPGLTAYLGYAEANRTPSPSEIECSSPTQPCLLPSSLSADPPGLKQVVSQTVEMGFRGSVAAGALLPGSLSWNAGLYRTDLDDDIYGVATSVSSGYFQNIGSTRREGLDAGLRYKQDKWELEAGYSLVIATFQSALTLASPNNPFADVNGNIHVQPGDRLPGIPTNRVKLGAQYHVTPELTVGASFTFESGQYLRGDESNQNPQLPGYEIVGIHASYDVTGAVELFGRIDNLFNTHDATFGEYGDPTGVNAPGIPPGSTTNEAGIDNRFVSPGPPLAFFGGMRIRF
jgi:iron complex outermembrane receptor protein